MIFIGNIADHTGSWKCPLLDPHASTFLCDRKSALGNPYIIGRDGDRDEVIALFKRCLWDAMKRHKKSRLMSHEFRLIQMLAALDVLVEAARVRDITLLCHCHPLNCHVISIKSAVEWLLQGGFEQTHGLKTK